MPDNVDFYELVMRKGVAAAQTQRMKMIAPLREQAASIEEEIRQINTDFQEAFRKAVGEVRPEAGPRDLPPEPPPDRMRNEDWIKSKIREHGKKVEGGFEIKSMILWDLAGKKRKSMQATVSAMLAFGEAHREERELKKENKLPGERGCLLRLLTKDGEGE